MRITRNQLRRIIKEELSRVLISEQMSDAARARLRARAAGTMSGMDDQLAADPDDPFAELGAEPAAEEPVAAEEPAGFKAELDAAVTALNLDSVSSVTGMDDAQLDEHISSMIAAVDSLPEPSATDAREKLRQKSSVSMAEMDIFAAYGLTRQDGNWYYFGQRQVAK